MQATKLSEPEIDSNNPVIFEDEQIVIVNKSGNCPMHEGGMYKENCITRILEKKYGKRVYPVYRLDRETSGIVVFAKSRNDVKSIFGTITQKEYSAIVKGEVMPQIIDAKIGEVKGEYIDWKKGVTENGAKAITEIIGSEKIGNFSLIRLNLKTGRQHQIRVHLQHIGHPIIHDKIYGESDKIFKDYLEGKNLEGRQALHLGKIVLGKKTFEAELPFDMKTILNGEHSSLA